MKLLTPEICWHERKPIYSVDFQYLNGEMYRMATSGTDKNVRIWGINLKKEKIEPEFLSTLSRHLSGVNCVRFSPNGEFLASAGDDNVVLIWKLDETQSDAPMLFGDDDEQDECKETWKVVATLRGHLQDIYDLCWSGDGNFIITGSIDNCAILYDVKKGTNLGLLREAKSFVQGVAYDPLGDLAATLSSDRHLRIYNAQTLQCINKISKMATTVQNSDGEDKQKSVRLFHDDGSSYKSFFRRLSFSPDGELLVAPAGCLDQSDEFLNTTHVFSRGNFSKPVSYLPVGQKVAVAVRFCPMLFELRKNVAENSIENERKSVYNFPYRMVFAVATEDSVLMYDTQQISPFAMVSNIHYSMLNDLSWSSDGRLLAVSSSDGYVSLVAFDVGEIGTPYNGKIKAELRKENLNLKNSLISMKQQNSPKVSKAPLSPKLNKPNSPLVVKPASASKPMMPPAQNSPKKSVPPPRRINLISLSKSQGDIKDIANQANKEEKMEIVPEKMEVVSEKNEEKNDEVIQTVVVEKPSVEGPKSSPVKQAPRRIQFTTLSQ